LDVACGRGGNMFRIADEYTLAVVDGINITHYQAEYCTDEINTRGFQDRMEVRQANFLSMPYPNDTYSHEYCCEVTQYTLDLSVLFDEVYRTLKPGGVFVIATWCYNEDKPINRLREIIEPINTHYASTMHSNAAYKDALITSGFKITHDEDRTEDLIPYWELRDGWDMASGIESNFIDGHTDRTLLYKFFIGVK
jgi:ubiquinone/menaquinone biosynthesis C-methylase UbiE